MKLSLAITLIYILLNSITALTQRPATIGHPQYLGDRRIMVVEPAWSTAKTMLNAIAGQRTREFTFADVDLWIKKYNKENSTNYIFLNTSVSYGNIVLVTPDILSGINEDSARYLPIKQNDIQPLANDYFLIYSDKMSMSIREKMFFNNKLYNVSAYPATNFINTFGIPALRGGMRALPDKPGLLNGNISMQFHGDETNNVTGYFYGNMREGYADGFGLFVKPEQHAPLGYVRRGFWENGVFQQEHIAQKIADSLVYEILRGLTKNNLKVRVVEASFNRDLLFQQNTNGFTLVIYATWNDGRNDRFFTIEYTTPDFYNPPVINVVNKDNKGMIQMIDRANPSGLLNITDMIGATLKTYYTGTANQYDDYLKFMEQPETDCNPTVVGTYKTGGETDNFNPNYTSPVEEKKIYAYDKCGIISVYVRNTKASEWKYIGKINTTRQTPSSSNYSSSLTMYASSFMGHVFSEENYSSYGDMEAEIVPVIREKYPLPVNDTTREKVIKTPERMFRDNKTEALKSIVRSQNHFKYRPDNELLGFWEKDGNLIVINDTASQEKSFLVETFRFNKNDAYQTATYEATFKRQGNEIVLNITIGGKSDGATLKTTSITKDQIVFENGIVWTRVQ